MIDEMPALLARHLPGCEVRSVTVLGEGWDNVAYEVNGELVVRRSKAADPAERSGQVRREAELLAAVAGLSPLSVPRVVFSDPGAGVLAYAKLPGLPLSEHPPADPVRLAPVLGEFAARLHGAPAETMARLVPQDVTAPQELLDEAAGDYRQVAGLVPAAWRRRVEDFLGRTPPPGPDRLVFCHNDLGDEHVLADPATGAVTGIIDWTDAALADPAYDLALLHRDLGPEVLAAAADRYRACGGRWEAADHERAVFHARCALLEDIAYGVRTGSRRYTEAGLARLAPVFS
ncbi:aminoglycoside phosphotransferase family protein [Planomonospora alba]|uniref:Aminoglycoside phosphotransferase family protein n=1 Tax=Planomonospora alba TaxID=161354 RepID=A0ABP6NP57_9ACTN